MAMIACRYNPTLYTTRDRTSFCHPKRIYVLPMAATPNPKRFPVLTMAASLRPISLIGPPEIYQKPASTTTEKTNPFMDLLVENKNNVKIPPMGLTENGSPTFLSTGNPCLDFFFHVVPYTPPETLAQRLELAWNHDPLKTLKLVCNLRGIRGTGKSDRQGAYTAALWLHHNHPKTLARNVGTFADFGYSKDLVEILFRILEGPDVRRLSKEAYDQLLSTRGRSKSKKMQLKRRHKMHSKMKSDDNDDDDDDESHNESDEYESEQSDESDDENESELIKKNVAEQTEKENIEEWHEKQSKHSTIDKIAIWEAKRKLKREEKRINRAKRVVERFYSDPDFKFLHEQVSDYFARCLRSDMKMLSEGKILEISLAAKWCPSLDSTYDEVTLLCEPIGKKVFPREEYPEYEGVEEAHYAYRVRDRLRKQVLVPLRRALDLPEVYMAAKEWGSIPYGRVASVAMKTLQGKFFEHDEGRFVEYLDQVSMGKAKIAAGALLPHEIINSLNEYGGKVAELQWKRVVEDMANKGNLNNCMAICDVSGSMCGIPMEVSVALGVLVSELSEDPWKGKLITFSANPKLQTVEGNSLKEKTEFVREMEWGMNTDFQKVFDLLLQVAVNGKLKPEQMIKRLFVFSDMEFDDASNSYEIPSSYKNYSNKHLLLTNTETDPNRTWETDYEAIVRKFTEKGYGDCVPEIVFWNLRESRATPVSANQPGVALVSGFSKNMLTLFLEGGDLVPEAATEEDVNPKVDDAAPVMDPEAVMEDAISGDEYQKLAVFD